MRPGGPQMPRRALLGAGLAVGIVLVSLAVPYAPAQTVLPAPTGSAMVGFYLADDAVVPVKPMNQTSRQRSLATSGSVAIATPGTTVLSSGPWGSFNSSHNLAFVTDGVFTVFLAGRDVAHFEQVTVTLQREKDEDPFATGSSRITANTSRALIIDDTVKVTVGIPLAGQVVYAGDNVSVTIDVTGAALRNTPLDLVLLYGSEPHPSGLVVGVSDIGKMPLAATLQPLFLGNHSLTLEPPANDTDRVRDVPGGDATFLALSEEWQWGMINSTRDTRLYTDTPITVWVGPAEGSLGGVQRDLQATLTVDSLASRERANVRVSVNIEDGVTKYVLGLPTAGMRIWHNSTLRLNFTLWATDDSPTGDYVMYFGSTDKPAALALGVTPRSQGIGRLGEDPDAERLRNLNRTGATGTGDGDGTRGTGDGDGDGDGTGDDGQAKDVSPRNNVPGFPTWMLLAAVVGVLAAAARRR